MENQAFSAPFSFPVGDSASALATAGDGLIDLEEIDPEPPQSVVVSAPAPKPKVCACADFSFRLLVLMRCVMLCCVVFSAGHAI